MRRTPTLTLTVIATLAIGIGSNTAMFSVVNGILLKPPPYPDADALIAVWQSGAASLIGQGEPDQVRAIWVTQHVLPALAIQPTIGLWLSLEDDPPGTPETVMLGYGYWKRRFGGDAGVVGRIVTIDARLHLHQVIGVMPGDFRFLDVPHNILLAERIQPADRKLSFRFQGIARLKSGVTIMQADADVARMLSHAMALVGLSGQLLESLQYRPALRPLKQEVVGDMGEAIWVLMTGLGIVLLIACINVANLLQVRAESRRSALAIRPALGASWLRIARELLVESLTLGATEAIETRLTSPTPMDPRC